MIADSTDRRECQETSQKKQPIANKGVIGFSSNDIAADFNMRCFAESGAVRIAWFVGAYFVSFLLIWPASQIFLFHSEPGLETARNFPSLGL